MSVDLTGSGAWQDPVTTMGDGDPISMAEGALLRQGFQALVDRDSYLKAVLDNGVTKARKVTSTAALKAIAEASEGDLAILAVGGVPRLFCFHAGSAAGADVVGLRYDSTALAGYWVSSLFYLANTSGPEPRLDVQTLPPPNRVFSVAEDGEASGTTNATTLGGAFGPTLVVTMNAGDIAIIDGHCTFAPQAADADGYVAISVDGVMQALSKRVWSCANLGAHPLTPGIVFTASSSGDVSVRLYQQANTITAGTPQFKGPRSVRALVIRP